MNTTMIELACLGLAFGTEKATGNRQQATGERATVAAWKRLLREEGFLGA